MNVQVNVNGKIFEFDVLDSMKPMEILMVELTSRCNLRCSYCSKNQPENDKIHGRNEDMKLTLIDRAIDFVKEYRPRSLLLTGTGETTFLKEWVDICTNFLNIHQSIMLNTNIARTYTQQEIDTLSKFNELHVSIDSADPDEMKKLRSNSDLRTIAFNILRIKANSLLQKRRIPMLHVNCTVTTVNAFNLLNLAYFCLVTGVHSVAFSDVMEFGYADSHLGIRSIGALDNQQLAQVSLQLTEAMSVLKNAGIACSIQPSLQGKLTGINIKKENFKEGLTRICLQPWTRITIAADGAVFPCCLTEQPNVGYFNNPIDITNSLALRDFRKNLLTGNIPLACRVCTNAPIGTKEQLLNHVASLLFQSLQKNQEI